MNPSPWWLETTAGLSVYAKVPIGWRPEPCSRTTPCGVGFCLGTGQMEASRPAPRLQPLHQVLPASPRQCRPQPTLIPRRDAYRQTNADPGSPAGVATPRRGLERGCTLLRLGVLRSSPPPRILCTHAHALGMFSSCWSWVSNHGWPCGTGVCAPGSAPEQYHFRSQHCSYFPQDTCRAPTRIRFRATARTQVCQSSVIETVGQQPSLQSWQCQEY